MQIVMANLPWSVSGGKVVGLLLLLEFCGLAAGLLCYDCISYTHRRPKNLDTCIKLDDEKSPPIENANFCYAQVYENANASANGKSIRVTTRSDVHIPEGQTSDEHGPFLGFAQNVFCRDEIETNFMANWNTKLPEKIKARTCYCKTDYCNAPA